MNDRRTVRIFSEIFHRIHAAAVEPAGVRFRTENIRGKCIVKRIKLRGIADFRKVEIVVVVQDIKSVFRRKFRVPADQCAGFFKQCASRKAFLGKPADRKIFHADRSGSLQKIRIGFQQIADGNVEREHRKSRVRCELRQLLGRHSHQSEPFRTVVSHGTHLCESIRNFACSQMFAERIHLQCFFHI